MGQNSDISPTNFDFFPKKKTDFSHNFFARIRILSSKRNTLKGQDVGVVTENCPDLTICGTKLADIMNGKITENCEIELYNVLVT